MPSDLLNGIQGHVQHLEEVVHITRQSQIAVLQQLSELEQALDKLNASIPSDTFTHQLQKLRSIQQRVAAAFEKLKIVEVAEMDSRITTTAQAGATHRQDEQAMLIVGTV